MGGAGGGGNATKTSGVSGGSGTSNTGGGGAGGSYVGGLNSGGQGGSGIVIIRYPNTFKLATSSTNATYLSTGTWNVYTFNSSGSITF